jgi:hypothetical protein
MLSTEGLWQPSILDYKIMLEDIVHSLRWIRWIISNIYIICNEGEDGVRTQSGCSRREEQETSSNQTAVILITIW